MLLLFDIDGTLLLTRGAGIRAMTRSGRDLHGPSFTMDGIDYAGALDPLIVHAAMERNAIRAEEQDHQAFRAGYHRHLETELAEDGVARMLPGVEELIRRLETVAGITLGLVTGNYPETGRLKLRRAGLDPDRFPIAGWGDDGPTRRDLPPVATRRFVERHGGEPPETVIIGDTIHDVDCGKAHDHRVLAVATGPRYTAAELAESGADLVVEDLSRTDDLIAWLTNGRA